MVWNLQQARYPGLVAMLFILLSACAATPQTTQTDEPQEAAPSTWLDRNATEQAAAILAGEMTSETLVRGYLRRIEQLDPKINSVLAVNPDALAEARARDQALANGEVAGPLHGIPVLLKDNIEATGMATTAGSMALINNDTGRDAPVVARLKAAGAIILGKTNLSEWANFRSESSISGWSAMGGLTHNPHLLNRSACGSSSGSGAAMAVRLASLAVGTETNGSIICPASMNGVVGFKPSVGLLSRRHIVPISHTQDTAGPMTRSVLDAAVMFQAMAGTDAKDPATVAAPEYLPPADTVTDGNLEGMRVGVVRFRQGDNPHVLKAYNAALDTLKAKGAVLVELNDFSQPDAFWPSSYKVLLSEFHHNINEYLADSPAELPARDLKGLMAFNNQTPRELALFDQSIFVKSLAAPAIDSDEYQEALSLVRTTAREKGIDQFLSSHNLDVIVAPSNSPAFMIDAIYGDHSPVGFIGIGYLAAVAGYPHLTVPVAEVKGLPVGLSFIGGQWQDMQVLRAGYLFEQAHTFTPEVQMAESRLQEPGLKALFQPLSSSADN
ncbi:amidase [Alteromonas sp. ASW11-19]|uniref:Amidase n=1 Tax=Alteromonas salexigens TaxID=2982530 RepID=A0ABT2VJQ6_9ALTE|nr:amidase [Alteromonas salexigens]MCU7553482.1 amidase [Alteromonas salexigens]